MIEGYIFFLLAKKQQLKTVRTYLVLKREHLYIWSISILRKLPSISSTTYTIKVHYKLQVWSLLWVFVVIYHFFFCHNLILRVKPSYIQYSLHTIQSEIPFGTRIHGHVLLEKEISISIKVVKT